MPRSNSAYTYFALFERGLHFVAIHSVHLATTMTCLVVKIAPEQKVRSETEILAIQGRSTATYIE